MATTTNPTLNVNLPGAGATQTYQMAAGTPVHFDFDIAEAVFSSSGNDLVITIEGGGSVVLQDYLTLAEQDSLPTFELMSGEVVAGDAYMFAFADGDQQAAEELETAADGAAGGSGAGAYSDDAGSLGDALDALGGQDDAYDVNVIQASPTTEPEALADAGDAVYPENEGVEIVLNREFQAHDDFKGSWSYMDNGEVDHWKNPAGANTESTRDDGRTEMWTERMAQKGTEYEAGGEGQFSRHMEIDSVSRSVDSLSQAIAVQEGEEVTINFNFSPRVGHNKGMDTNDFKVSLGDQEVATINWDGDRNGHEGEWVITLAEGVSVAEGTPLTFENYGYDYSGEVRETDWTELSFTLTAGADHAEVTFTEAGRDDSYGTLIDEISVLRNFHTVTYGEDLPDEGAEMIIGTEGDDAIFGGSRGVVDGVDDVQDVFHMQGGEGGIPLIDVIDGAGGDDAIYGGQNLFNILIGGEGDDFIVSGRPVYEGGEYSIGHNVIMPGEGNDYIRLGEGTDSVLIDKSALAGDENIVIENFSVGRGIPLDEFEGDYDGDTPVSGADLLLGMILSGGDGDHLFLTDDLRIADNGWNVEDNNLNLTITDGVDEVLVTLLGVNVPQAAEEGFVHDGPTADVMNDLIQEIIDNGGDLGGGTPT